MRLLLSLLAVLAFLSFGCGGDTRIAREKEALPGDPCYSNEECGTRTVCVDGFCRLPCTTDAECDGTQWLCSKGGCVPRPQLCGDGVISGTEQCDDGNAVGEDGCSAICTLEMKTATCGDGMVSGTEQCDDGNTKAGDGCSATCTKETPDWSLGAWGACSNTCGAGTQTRDVHCAKGDGTKVADGECAAPKPAESQACTGTDCPCSPNSCKGACVLDMPGSTMFTVPANCPSVKVQMWGGGGAGGSQFGATGGGGGYATAVIALKQGDALEVLVGEGGKTTGDGAGASWVRRSGTPLLVAGGGGGGGSDGCMGCASISGGAGGAGGGEDGQSLVGTIPGYCNSATGGQGGSATMGGAGGMQSGAAADRCDGEAGAKDTGGSSNGGRNGMACYETRAKLWEAGGGQPNGGGGGGGAGYYGGGGAGFIWTYCAGGGGGGSSYSAPANTQVTLTTGSRQSQAEATSSGGAGKGGDRKMPGSPGKVVLNWGG